MSCLPEKILFLTDLHKRDVDFTSIGGYVKAITAVQFDIIQFIKDNGITKVVIGGDWYDKGYRHTGPTLSDNELDRRLSDAVNGEVYITLGNHYYLERDNNPESYIIQPCEKHPMLRDIVFPENPIFKCVDELIIGNTQISFFHFDKHFKEYSNRKHQDVKYHVGVYHDDCVIPSNLREAAGYYGNTTSDYLETIYQNINMAIINHIHVSIGVHTLNLPSGKKLPLIIPGSLGITQNKESCKHKYVQLPVITVFDDETMPRCELKQFYTHIDMLKFYKKEEKSEVAKKLMSNVEIRKTELQRVPKARTLDQYLYSIGYNSRHIELVDKAAHGSLDVVAVHNILYKEVSVNDGADGIGRIDT